MINRQKPSTRANHKPGQSTASPTAPLPLKIDEPKLWMKSGEHLGRGLAFTNEPGSF
jgi:hypothetical protein